MKALDTGILLELLAGTDRGRKISDRLAGEEVATTELNLFELEQLAREAPKAVQRRRRAALERLRRRVTVVPITPSASARASELSQGKRTHLPSWLALMLAAAEVSGADVWVTDRGRSFAGGRARLRIENL